MRKLKSAPEDHEAAAERKKLQDYWYDLREYFRKKNLSITMKHHAAKAAKAAGAANPLVAARLQSVAVMQSMYMPNHPPALGGCGARGWGRGRDRMRPGDDGGYGVCCIGWGSKRWAGSKRVPAL